MLTEGTYRTEVSTSFELSRVYTTPVVRLWWMIIVSNDFLNFRNLDFGPFCRRTQAAITSIKNTHHNLQGFYNRDTTGNQCLLGIHKVNMPFRQYFSSRWNAHVKLILPALILLAQLLLLSFKRSSTTCHSERWLVRGHCRCHRHTIVPSLIAAKHRIHPRQTGAIVTTSGVPNNFHLFAYF